MGTTGTTGAIAGRLEQLRGELPTRNHNARTVAALAANPGCARRGVLDAAGIEKTVLAERLGFPARYGRSPFAIGRGNVFEARVKADDGRELRRLLAEVLGADPDDGALVDVDRGGPTGPTARPGREERVARTREALLRAASGDPDACAILDHPLLPLDVAGRRAYLEPDAMACRVAGRLHVVEIKSFAIIDGSADPGKLASATRQAAVYVHALRGLAEELGLDPESVSTDIVLVCAQDFANRPIAVVLDVRRELATTRRRLARLSGVEELFAELPEGLTFDVAEERVGAAVARVPAAYLPDCLSACELALFCRDEARACGTGGDVGTLGTSVRGALGGIDDIGTALALADGTRAPEPGQEDVARLLRRAQALRHEALGGVG
ncbi:hypothetical protein [Embleya hyalina]|uniref:Secreted protein n=1 Tax=Embleya hyalina TaxID=516124 RepID=A0A401Z443_9ACTN|nr:hypothetical protein [Embleya hyalina]GCE01608.1 hypothetical protein EHYA_09374 [Embleya hyalina]